jgi:hypothetical protein
MWYPVEVALWGAFFALLGIAGIVIDYVGGKKWR